MACPIGEVISEGNVGLMQAVKKLNPEPGLPPVAPMPCGGSAPRFRNMCCVPWELVKHGDEGPAQRKLFFNLRRMKGEMKAYLKMAICRG